MIQKRFILVFKVAETNTSPTVRALSVPLMAFVLKSQRNEAVVSQIPSTLNNIKASHVFIPTSARVGIRAFGR